MRVRARQSENNTNFNFSLFRLLSRKNCRQQHNARNVLTDIKGRNEFRSRPPRICSGKLSRQTSGEIPNPKAFLLKGFKLDEASALQIGDGSRWGHYGSLQRTEAARSRANRYFFLPLPPTDSVGLRARRSVPVRGRGGNGNGQNGGKRGCFQIKWL